MPEACFVGFSVGTRLCHHHGLVPFVTPFADNQHFLNKFYLLGFA
jgi:hypothetical protein